MLTIKDVKFVINLIKRDFKVKYLGSYLGFFWSFIQPIITILVFWFVFQVGFRTPNIGDFPYVLWLVAGIVPWFMFSEALMSGTTAIIQNSYLVNKISFNTMFLPIVKIGAAFVIHLFFIMFIFIISIYYKIEFSIYNIQIVYYSFCLISFLIGITWLTSSVLVFFKDLEPITSIIIQFGFWLTPIFWYNGTLSKNMEMYFKLNPVYYITEGYRNSVMFHKWFWEFPFQTLYFWSITTFFVIIGYTIFMKLKPHFSDVL